MLRFAQTSCITCFALTVASIQSSSRRRRSTSVSQYSRDTQPMLFPSQFTFALSLLSDSHTIYIFYFRDVMCHGATRIPRKLNYSRDVPSYKWYMTNPCTSAMSNLSLQHQAVAKRVEHQGLEQGESLYARTRECGKCRRI